MGGEKTERAKRDFTPLSDLDVKPDIASVQALDRPP